MYIPVVTEFFQSMFTNSYIWEWKQEQKYWDEVAELVGFEEVEVEEEKEG